MPGDTAQQDFEPIRVLPWPGPCLSQLPIAVHLDKLSGYGDSAISAAHTLATLPQQKTRVPGLAPATSVRRGTGLKDEERGDNTAAGTDALTTEIAAMMDESIVEVV